jgi:predicted ribosomally synthesized peptide with nif11-like leader
MSLEQAKKFIKRMKTEVAFRSNIMAVEDVADRQKLAKAEGYEFTEICPAHGRTAFSACSGKY